MKVLKRSIVKFSVFLSLFLLFCQTGSSQENHCGNVFFFEEILSKFTVRRTVSPEPVNKELIGEIRRRKIGFELNEANEKTLRDAGANDSVIKSIRENQQQEIIEAKLLYGKYVENYDSNAVEKVKIALESANSFIAKFGNDKCYTEQTEYFRDAIPMLEKFINKSGVYEPADPNAKYKYELLGRVENAYRIKNWDEVFVIGERVLDVDPEYIDLILVLASVGFQQTQTEVYKDKFNRETIRYAELAVKLMESGKYLKTQSYGALHFRYRTKVAALDRMKQILDFMKKRNS